MRRPPALHDLNIFATLPGTIRFDTSPSPCCVPGAPLNMSMCCYPRCSPIISVPGVAGAFVLLDVLSRAECVQVRGVLGTRACRWRLTLCAVDRLRFGDGVQYPHCSVF